MHPLAVYLLFFPLAAQADLYKCVDNASKVTYTNSSCAKAGLKEAKIIPPPPPPALDAPASKPSQPDKNLASKPAEPESKVKQTAALQVMKSMQSNSKACARLNGDMGRIMDEMDSARSNSVGAKQQSAWNLRLDELQAEKSKLGCF